MIKNQQKTIRFLCFFGGHLHQMKGRYSFDDFNEEGDKGKRDPSLLVMDQMAPYPQKKAQA